MQISVVITTYNQPGQLEKVMWGYAGQRGPDFELVVADDGSGSATTDVVDRVATSSGLRVVHVWHADRGFRKTEILNRAILASGGEYLIFSDGDCIPRDDFVAAHARLARRGSFLSGGYIKLPRDVSASITLEDIKSGRAVDAGYLRRNGWRPGKRALRLLRAPVAASILDRLTTTKRTWNGHNSSTWRDALIAANGYDLDMSYGGLDRALGERLENGGIKGLQVRHRTPCLHLYHERPYETANRWRQNDEIRKRIRENHETRARQGLEQLPLDESVVIRRPGHLIQPQPERAAIAR